ncbi:helix-turn-helix transcriptional regulator [Streptomyces sp. NPDC007369]|uniref:helix-turn-helix transcriptional regulator n=1 Tax=Streptomyces sp. NPDC007369 TaxID=3154589 RepID=UPI0033F47121
MAETAHGTDGPDTPRSDRASAPVPVPAAGAPFCDRLNFLFDRVRPPGAEEYTNAHVARTISSYGEDSYTRSHISLLRAGKRTPTITMVPLLARFFGVEAAYFVEDEVTRKVATQFEILRKLKENGVEQIALRAMGVSAAGQRKVLAALEAVRKEEGLPADPERDLP